VQKVKIFEELRFSKLFESRASFCSWLTISIRAQPKTPSFINTTMLNLFYPDDYSDYYFSPHEARRREELMRRRELEARRRRAAELEYYQQMKAEEERRKRIEAMRRLKQQLQEEEEYRQRQYEATRRRQQQEELLRQRSMGGVSAGGRRRVAMAYPEGTILRGPDGRLYRVIRDTPMDVKMSDLDETQPAKKTVRVNSLSEHGTDMVDEAVKEFTSPEDQQSPAPKETTKTKKTKKPRHKRVTITVEDASDSETEDDHLDSVFRNRRPSPGQWIEPVDGVF
jgi:hypothetical protein